MELTYFIDYAELNGPPAGARQQKRLFFEENKTTVVLWKQPDDFRNVFEMMAEDMFDAADRAWYGLPPSKDCRYEATKWITCLLRLSVFHVLYVYLVRNPHINCQK